MSINPQIFEATMLICFGSAWPASIYRVWKAKCSEGKSIYYLIIVFIGYMAGILFEFFGAHSSVIYLYLLNAAMVLIDTALTIKYRKKPCKIQKPDLN
jgi:hypothetical protein